MRALGWIAKIIVILIVVSIVVVGVFLATFDANKYRPQIATAISQQLGREVKLDGPIKLGISWQHGFDLTIQNVTVANPSWARRPLMAKVGKLELGVAIQPLLRHDLQVTSLSVADADIQLETGPSGQTNWEFKTSETALPEKAAPEKQTESGKKPMTFQIGSIDVRQSRVAMIDKTGKESEIKITRLTLSPDKYGSKLTFEGEANGQVLALDLTSQKPLLAVMNGAWPFDAEIRFAPYVIQANGTLDVPTKQAMLATYEIKAKDTVINGKLDIAYGGARPLITGTLNSDKLDPNDLKGDKAEEKTTTAAEPKSGGTSGAAENHVFSREPLDLSGLKAADARLDIAISEIPVGPSALKHLKTKLDLENGRLLLSPLKMEVGGTLAEGQLKVDASTTPAQFSTMFKAYQLDLAQLVKLGGLQSFLESKGDMDMDIVSSGNSLHDFASNANGQINLVMAGGSVSQSVLSDVAGGLLNLFAPGTGTLAKPDLNCFVAHFKITNGKLETQGLLADTGQATIAGTGDVNLRDETIDMVLATRTKAVQQLGDLTPPLRVTGPLTKPSYVPDAKASLEKVAGILGGGSFGGNGVPEMIQQAGQNACEYTLKHGKASNGTIQVPKSVQDTVNKAKEKVQDLGGKVMEGLGGLFGK